MQKEAQNFDKGKRCIRQLNENKKEYTRRVASAREKLEMYSNKVGDRAEDNYRTGLPADG